MKDQTDYELIKHKQWLGMIQPVGLVVSPYALNDLQCHVTVNVIPEQEALKNVVSVDGAGRLIIEDFATFTQEVLRWQPDDLIADIPPDLIISLPEWHDLLKPDFFVPDPDTNLPMILIQVYDPDVNLDALNETAEKLGKWNVSPQSKLERLLAESGVSIGILTNGLELRLVYRPPMEMPGYLPFLIAPMIEVSGRLILSALDTLLSADRLFVLPTKQRLPNLLQASRKYQAVVSARLATQVLNALWELLRGFEESDTYTGNRPFAHTPPDVIYGGIVTVLLRLVFLLYAEDNGLMPTDDIYEKNYSVSGLYRRLRDDADNYPDTMDLRFGAWAHLVSLFKFIYDGGGFSLDYLPQRHGELFDPNQYPFLAKNNDDHLSIPRVSDGVVLNILQGLLILDGERLSYRSLAVEEIGSVYQEIMGFAVEKATGVSIAVAPEDVVINLDDLLRVKPNDRNKFLQDQANCDLSGKSLADLKIANSINDLIAAIGRKVSPRTSYPIKPGNFYLQPTQERRRSGSHYTPASLTQPIVETALKPILANLGLNPTPEQILDLKICDPAMGSGAFLVEACRQLANVLVAACETHQRLDLLDPLLSDSSAQIASETEDFGLTKFDFAKRLIAQRCLYGVDKNPFAVSLAKLSLWLTTLAKNYAFTFIDHAFKHGDSLMGLTRDQIRNFTWFSSLKEQSADLPLLNQNYWESVQSLRGEILVESDYDKKSMILEQIKLELVDSQLRTNLIINSFFDGDKDKVRKDFLNSSYLIYGKYWERSKSNNLVSFADQDLVDSYVSLQAKSLTPFNWEVEFPEVFNRQNPGFDVIVGNPPFAGKNTLINAHAEGYIDWLKVVNPESHGNADLVAHFFRRSFTLLRQKGCLGLIATNTISQGDTRNTGLRFICENGGVIYQAIKRFKWPGLAAVVVSVIHIEKAKLPTISPILDDKNVPKITAFLFPGGGNNDPYTLLANAGKSFIGSFILGMGFTFDDTNPDATNIAEMERLIASNPKNQECIFPYIGGEEVNSHPTHAHHRYVINFGEMSEDECRKNYPDLMKIVEEKVKPERAKLGNNPDALRRKNRWWLWGRYTPALFEAITHLDRVLVCCLHSQYLTFAFLPSKNVFSHALCVFSDQKYAFFSILQSRIHEIWTRFFSSSLGDGLRYTPSDCFQTFPFPENWDQDEKLEKIGQKYYEFRAALMVKNNQGLTETYNRFHNPEERDQDIIKLRELHQEMDNAVLKAYQWEDLQLKCDFILEYEDDQEDDEDSRKRQRKKPWRYRWDSELHNEILARLLDLNKQRYEQEILGGKKAEPKKIPQAKKAKKPRKNNPDQINLL